MPKCEGCNKKKKHKRLQIWEGLFGNLLLCLKCFNWAVRFNDLNEAASFNILVNDEDEED